MTGDQPGWSALTGQSAKEAAGPGWLAAVHPEDRERTRAAWEAAVERGAVLDLEHQVRRADAAYRQFAVRVVPVQDELGGIREWVGVHTDITERKRAEAERERLVRALAKNNQDLNEFAYVASHDLKAPLRGITLLSEWLEEDMGAGIPVAAREKLHLLRGRARRLEGLIEGILNYSRAGRSGAERTLVDVRGLLREVIDLLGKPALDAVAIADNPWPALSTERAALEQVFMNLISNAIKHGASENLRIQVSAERDDAFWRFSVLDNGPGIAPEYHERIWGIFQMLQARDKVEGAGIGLAIVKKIVEGKGGRAWVVSAPGSGAKFCFTWPQQEAEAT
jgi:PAS domain S-box-containing protein